MNDDGRGLAAAVLGDFNGAVIDEDVALELLEEGNMGDEFTGRRDTALGWRSRLPSCAWWIVLERRLRLTSFSLVSEIGSETTRDSPQHGQEVSNMSDVLLK